MINSPNDSGQDWDSMINDVKSNVLKKINKLLNILEKHKIEPIVKESIINSYLLELIPAEAATFESPKSVSVTNVTPPGCVESDFKKVLLLSKSNDQ